MYDSAPIPFGDLAILLRWFAGLLATIVGPGYLLVGRRLESLDLISRLGLSLAVGLVFTSLVTLLFSILGIPLFWWANPGLAVLLTFAWTRFRGGFEPFIDLDRQFKPLSTGDSVFFLVITAALATLIGQEFQAYSVPPGLHDASNHSYLALRILETRSISSQAMFTGLLAPPPIPYLVGVHAAAALVSDCCGVAPYISIWFLAASCAALYPLMFSILWRLFGFEAPAVRIGGLLLAFSYYAPIGLFSWGGLGAIVGLIMVPWLVLVLASLADRPGVVTAAVAGLSCVAMIHIHATELFVGLVFAGLAFGGSTNRRWNLRFRSRPTLVFALLVMICGIAPLVGYAAKYQGLIGELRPAAVADFAHTWKIFLWRIGGGVDFLRNLVLFGLLSGIVLRPHRRIALFAFAVALVYFTLITFQDPVSRTLTKPFYAQANRVLYLACLLLPPLAGSGLVGIGRLLIPEKRRRVRQGVYVLLIATIVWLGAWPGSGRCRTALRDLRLKSPFSPGDWELAREIGNHVPREAVVANLGSDGSFWIQHIGGCRLLDPCGWRLSQANEEPWRYIAQYIAADLSVPKVQKLREAGVNYFFVKTTEDGWSRPGLTFAELANHARFEVLLANDGAALYRVLWSK